MDYKEFVCAVEREMNVRLEGKAKASRQIVVKNNHTEKEGIVVESDGDNLTPTIYLDGFYEAYRKGVEFSRVVDNVELFYEKVCRKESWSRGAILDFEGVKNQIVFRVIGTAANREFLKGVPHKEVLDLSIVFYIMIEMEKDGEASMPVMWEHLRRWGIKESELFSLAMKNTTELLPPCLYNIDQVIAGLASPDGFWMNMDNLLEEEESRPDKMYVLTNKTQKNGAACMFYPNVLKQVGDVLRQDYYLIPSSVHEMIVFPVSSGVNYKNLNEMIVQVNQDQVQPEEVLSDHAYFCRFQSHVLEMETDRVGKEAAI